MIDGEDVALASAPTLKRLRQEIQIVFQNPYGSLNPRQTIGKALEEPLLVNTAMSAAEREGRRARNHGEGRPPARISITAIRICFPAASGNASPSRVRLC